MKILAVCGSLRKDSFNRMALRAAQSMAPSGVQVEIFDLHGIPVYSQDDDAQPDRVGDEGREHGGVGYLLKPVSVPNSSAAPAVTTSPPGGGPSSSTAVPPVTCRTATRSRE